MSLPRSFQIDRSGNVPLTAQIHDHYADAIRTGGILFGTRLPSIRDLVAHLGVNKISIISAYERLVDEGLVSSRPGSGFFVSHRPRAARSPEGASAPSPKDARQSAYARMPRVLLSAWHAPASLVSLGSSHVPSEQTLLDELRSVSRHVLLDSEKMTLAYEQPQGNLELRERIAAEVELRGLPVTGADQVLMTSGALQALNLALEVLCKPGDSVAAEVPAFTLLFPLLAHRQLRLVEMPRGFDGLDITADTEQSIKREKPKVILVSPNFHNPLGGSLSPHQRLEVVRLATETGATIIELDVFHGLHFGDIVPPPIGALDAMQRTLYISSFSKTLAPGLRLGYICGNPALLARMVHKKTILDVSSSSLDQSLLCELMARGYLRKHLARVKDVYRSRRDTLTAMLRKLAPQGSQWTSPEGGIFLWFAFPPGPTAADIERTCLEKNVALAPGNLFHPDDRESDGMRMNFATLEPVHTYKALETTFAVWRAAASRRWAGSGMFDKAAP